MAVIYRKYSIFLKNCNEFYLLHICIVVSLKMHWINCYKRTMLFTFFVLIKIKGSITELSVHFSGKPFNLMLKNESERYYAKATLFQKLT